MGLSPEEIQKLLAKPVKTRTATGKSIDASQRDYVTWFKLSHKLYDSETGERAQCSNPECADHREGNKMIVEVNGKMMCRYCFLGGYGL